MTGFINLLATKQANIGYIIPEIICEILRNPNSCLHSHTGGIYA
jgi:hypothetical protein